MFFLAGVSIRFLSLRKRCCTRQLLCVRAQCRRVVVDWHKRALGQQIGRREAAQRGRHESEMMSLPIGVQSLTGRYWVATVVVLFACGGVGAHQGVDVGVALGAVVNDDPIT